MSHVRQFQEFCYRVLREIAPCPILTVLPMPPGSGGMYSPWPQPAATGWWAGVPEERRETYIGLFVERAEKSLDKPDLTG